MYTPPMFKPNRAACLAFAQVRGFGTVTAWDGFKPIASSLPFYLTSADDGTPHAAFHVARHNPLTKLADGKSRWLMAVTGADAYVSADWYASPDQVPTWLYQAVHLTGVVRMLPDQELGPHLDALSGKFESWLGPKPPWTSAKMTAGRLEALKKSIVGMVMPVDEVEGSFNSSSISTNPMPITWRLRWRWRVNRSPPPGSWRAKCARCAPSLSQAGRHNWMPRRGQRGTLRAAARHDTGDRRCRSGRQSGHRIPRHVGGFLDTPSLQSTPKMASASTAWATKPTTNASVRNTGRPIV
jgi:transcriptional regulator